MKFLSKEQNTLIAAVLFLTQIMHLVWLALFVIALRLNGRPIWEPSSIWETLLIIFDYFEIPALLSATVLYIGFLARGENTNRAILFLIFINLQYLHIFWITDEFVIDKFTSAEIHSTILPAIIAWLAILVDYLEIPVMIDTFKRSAKILKSKFSSQTL